jgi:hypothetical protein
MAENGQVVDLVELFDKASKAAERAVGDGGMVGAEEVRCTEALKAMGSFPVSTAILMSTQVFNPCFFPSFLAPSDCPEECRAWDLAGIRRK